MAKPHGVTESEIKAAIKAAQSAFEDQERLRASLSQGARLLSLRRKLGERLQPVFAEAGLDIEKINKILAEYQPEELSLLEEEKSKTAKTFEALSQNVRREIENRRKAQEHLAAFKHPIVTPISLWTAYLIEEVPGDLPFAPHIEASNNEARTFFEHGTNGNGSVDVNFWFYWQNPSQYVAVLSNVGSDLVLFGTSYATANTHIINNGDVSLYLSAKLTGYTIQGSSSSNVVSIQNVNHLKGDHYNHCNIGDCPETVNGTFADTYHLSISWPILVPPLLGVSFAVNFHVEYSIYNGRVGFDFDSPGRFVMCPSVQMDLLTAPQVTVA